MTSCNICIATNRTCSPGFFHTWRPRRRPRRRSRPALGASGAARRGWPGRRQCGALGWPRRQERRTTYRAVTKKKALKTAVQAVNANMAAATANPDEAGLRHDVEAATETLTSNKQRHARWAWKRGSRKRGSRAQKASDTEGTTRVMANCPERRETEGWRVKSCIGTGVRLVQLLAFA